MTVKCANARLHRTQTTLHSGQGDGCAEGIGTGRGRTRGRRRETQRVDMHKCKCYGSSNGNTYANYSSPTVYAAHREKRKNNENNRTKDNNNNKNPKRSMNKSKSGEIPTRRSGSETMSDTQTHICHMRVCVRVCAVICMDSHSDTHSHSQLHALLWQVVHELITQWTTKCCIVHYRKTPQIVVVS